MGFWSITRLQITSGTALIFTTALIVYSSVAFSMTPKGLNIASLVMTSLAHIWCVTLYFKMPNIQDSKQGRRLTFFTITAFFLATAFVSLFSQSIASTVDWKGEQAKNVLVLAFWIALHGILIACFAWNAATLIILTRRNRGCCNRSPSNKQIGSSEEEA